MFNNPKQKSVFLAVGLFVLACFLVLIIGCMPLNKLEDMIWNPPTQTEGDKAAGDPPPLIQLIAGGLAALGYTGMAGWIVKIKKNGRRDLKEETDRTVRMVTALSERVRDLEDK